MDNFFHDDNSISDSDIMAHYSEIEAEENFIKKITKKIPCLDLPRENVYLDPTKELPHWLQYPDIIEVPADSQLEKSMLEYKENPSKDKISIYQDKNESFHVPDDPELERIMVEHNVISKANKKLRKCDNLQTIKYSNYENL